VKVDADALTLAWYLHDIVKKKNSRVDEERSGKYAYDTCVKALREDIAEKVKKCVLVTKHDEKHLPITIEEQLVQMRIYRYSGNRLKCLMNMRMISEENFISQMIWNS